MAWFYFYFFNNKIKKKNYILIIGILWTKLQQHLGGGAWSIFIAKQAIFFILEVTSKLGFENKVFFFIFYK